jgi:hypothetical protein
MATFTLTAGNGDDMTAEVSGFADVIGLNRAAPDRCSLLLTLGLFGGFKSGRLNPTKVVHEIRALEGLGPSSRLKAPVQNKWPPLKGLWHKHYQEDGISSLARNIQKGLRRYGIPLFGQMIAEATAAGEERYVSVEDIPAIAADVVNGNFARLADQQALTGEWLIFARYDDRNYYLCLATHDPQHHDGLRHQIDTICCEEFPFLPALLASA